MNKDKNKTKNLSVPFLRIQDAATVTGLSQYYLRRGAQNGTIPHIRSGRTIFINVPALLEQLDEQS
ncbi:MAG: helix-turn-helix domain-containing protein [Clostridiales bacterium]|nr:helix-turn-helix domain-containing protein [Clostridiales bacterium]